MNGQTGVGAPRFDRSSAESGVSPSGCHALPTTHLVAGFRLSSFRIHHSSLFIPLTPPATRGNLEKSLHAAPREQTCWPRSTAPRPAVSARCLSPRAAGMIPPAQAVDGPSRRMERTKQLTSRRSRKWSTTTLQCANTLQPACCATPRVRTSCWQHTPIRRYTVPSRSLEGGR